jgi:AraC family transcriptional regulator, regulatory protein of adaptative response / methylated-DNA-[protein]-cysteine methyltransferase
MELTKEIMYAASVAKNVDFEGIFITAVKTTGIFCRPSCTARKPKIENVEFFKTTDEAAQKGYRPCKVCKPLENLGQIPAYIEALIMELEQNPTLKLRDVDLIEKGIEPSAVRRWFSKNHGVTFQTFQRTLRINAALKKIQNGESLTSVAYNSGYESLSGFNDSFKNIIGVAPSKAKIKS